MTPLDYWLFDFRTNWNIFFSKKKSFLHFLLAVAYFVSITLLFKNFLVDFENIPGVQLEDILLYFIPIRDVSEPLFIILYLTVFYNYIFLFAYPEILKTFVIFYSTALLLRFIMLYVIHLEAPHGMILLEDPILSSSTYNGITITKDLFFSGHMVSVLCCYFTMPNRTLRHLYLVACILIGVLLLIQHIHYTIDILGAIIVVYLLYRIYFRKLWLNSQYKYQYSKEIINVDLS